MRLALAIGALACTGAMGDEFYSTYGGVWGWSYGWPTMGQVFTVPEGSTVLQSFTFSPKEWDDENDGIYILSVYDWDDEDGHVVGDPHFVAIDSIPEDLAYETHVMDLHLAANARVAVIAQLVVADPDKAGIGFDGDDPYPGGAMVTTGGAIDEPWQSWEEQGYDLAFSAYFRTCLADMNGDGVLNILDFVAFQGAFESGDMVADCNEDADLNVIDFVCFQARFEQGCVGQ
jgi:hypothetical protein